MVVKFMTRYFIEKQFFFLERIWFNFYSLSFGFLVLFMSMVSFASPSLSEDDIETETIYSGSFKPVPAAIIQFSGEGNLGERISQVIRADLERSGYFKLLPEEEFPEEPSLNKPPNFEAWRNIGIRAVIVGTAERDSSGRLKAEFRLWDTFSGTQLAGQRYFTDPAYWRRISHIISDSIYTVMTGFGAFFDTSIVFVDETGDREVRQKRLAIMDQDGANVRYLTRADSLVVAPRYSPVSQEVTYMSQIQGEPPKIQIINLENGARQIVGNFPDMTSSPRFSPDGKKIIMSLQQRGNANIYELDLENRRTTRLTDTNAIDTSPSYAPDGSKVVFESDRGGRQQIYIMNSDGSDQKRLSFGDGSYSQPIWSPRGDYIAFTRRSKGKFGIGIMKPDGSGERILTEGYHNESPSWAPNGQYIIFFRDPGGQSGGGLYMVDIFGQVEVRIPTPSYASDPAWSPLLSSGRGTN